MCDTADSVTVAHLLVGMSDGCPSGRCAPPVRAMSDLPESPPGPSTTVTLHDGREVLIRPLRPEDGVALQTGLGRMSPDSRYRRFAGAMPRLSDAQARYFADVDGVDHVAFGASDPANPSDDGNPEGLGIGTARYIRTKHDHTVADIALTVVDDYQRLGLGGILLDHLIDHARRHGVGTLSAAMLTENRAVQRLLAGRGFELRRAGDASLLEGRLELDPDGGAPHR
jgi:GNAT superfamily N-acetyltransferase